MRKKYFNYKLNESKLNNNYIKDFIIENIDILKNYELEDVYINIVLKKLQNELPESYITYSVGKFIDDVTKVSIDSNSTYDVIYATFKNALDTFGVDDAKIKKELSYSCSQFYYEGKGELKYSIQYGINNISDLIPILYWVLYNDFIGYNEVDKIRKNHDIDIYTLMFNEKFPELGNIEIRYFKNGTIKIKGLSSEELDRLQYVFTICKK